jgi:hypothetical protein
LPVDVSGLVFAFWLRQIKQINCNANFQAVKEVSVDILNIAENFSLNIPHSFYKRNLNESK